MRPTSHPAFLALRDELGDAYDQYADIRAIADQAHLDLRGIVLEKVPPRTAWSNVLEAAWKAKLLPAVVAAALSYSNIEAFRASLEAHRDALLAAPPPPAPGKDEPHPVRPWRWILAGAGLLVVMAAALFLARHALFPSCTDGARDGDETDVDCGGVSCGKCADNRRCGGAADCLSGFCAGSPGVCQGPTCVDRAKNGAETDIDCGGGKCPACVAGKVCGSPADCAGGVCIDGSCFAPTCADRVKNGAETDIDCGGGQCAACGKDRSCALPTDCATGACINHVCQETPCQNGRKDGDETDVDCGGSCPPCAAGKACKGPKDCAAGSCVTGTCKVEQRFCGNCPRGCEGATRPSAPPPGRSDCAVWTTCDGSCK